ncbi:MAG: cytochrome-c oxidase, cbb3-type subunit III [Sphingomonas sp.]
MTEEKQVDAATGTELNGHEWDGIRELSTPLPRWWLWTFYATIVFAIGYCIAYPAIPLLNGATPGMLGWTSRSALATDVDAARAARGVVTSQLARAPIEAIDPESPLMRAAVEGGRAAFKVNCVQCHGSGAAGSRGYPNLNDDDWLWGGTLPEIYRTIQHGAREPADDETRASAMPAFGRDGLLTADQIQDVVSYVRMVSREEPRSRPAQRGAALFANNCAVCHGADAKGNRTLGAPNLTDPIWLYGGDRETLAATVTNARQGVMPAWQRRLDPVTVKMLAAYVHSLGGGE